MKLARIAYFMSLAGGIAGLVAWALISLLSFLIIQSPTRMDLIAKVVLGALLGGMSLAFQDYWSKTPVMARWVLLGVALGATAGFVAGIIQIPIGRALTTSLPFISRWIAWMLAGALIGFALGFRWISDNPLRVALSFFGGWAGGAVGGLLFSGLGGGAADWAAAGSYILVGAGIAAGCTMATKILRTGILEFVSSSDPATHSKYTNGENQNAWELRDGDTYVIGSRAPNLRETQFRIQPEIWLPDTSAANRHAKVYASQGRFYAARHPEISEQPARYLFKVRNKTVVGVQELADLDDLIIGATTFRFMTKRRAKASK